jgi:hypothetical protein
MTKEEFNELLTGCEHDGSMIHVNEVKRLIEKAIADHEAFTREIIVRAKLDFPLTEQEIDWFDMGTDAKKCPEFMEKVMNIKPYQP